jgi:hypothetical protein
MAQNLTVQVLRMKGVPEADIGAAINDPAQMRDLLNQLYGRGPMAANGNSGGGAGCGLLADRPDPNPAAPDNPPPFGWAGLATLLR